MLKKLLPYFLKLIVAGVFILSAITKLLTIDFFELYIYGFGFASFNFASIVSRLIISFELFLALWLILNIYHKQVWFTTVIVLSAFTIFLGLLQITGIEGNCNCFGEVIKLNPLESIFKNIFILVLLVFSYRSTSLKVKYQKIILPALLLLSICLIVIISPPDFLMKYGKKQNDKFKFEEFETTLVKYNYSIDSIGLNDEKMVIAFLSPKCKFCKLAAKKMNVILNKSNAIDKALFVFFGDNRDIETFFSETGIKQFHHVNMPVDDFFKFSTGSLPEILLIENNLVIQTYGFRTIDEERIITFLE